MEGSTLSYMPRSVHSGCRYLSVMELVSQFAIMARKGSSFGVTGDLTEDPCWETSMQKGSHNWRHHQGSFVTNFHAERILSLHVTSSRILLEEHLFREDPLATLLSLAVDLVGPRVDKLWCVFYREWQLRFIVLELIYAWACERFPSKTWSSKLTWPRVMAI